MAMLFPCTRGLSTQLPLPRCLWFAQLVGCCRHTCSAAHCCQLCIGRWLQGHCCHTCTAVHWICCAQDEGLRFLTSKAEIIDELETTLPKWVRSKSWYPPFVHILKLHPDSTYEVSGWLECARDHMSHVT